MALLSVESLFWKQLQKRIKNMRLAAGFCLFMRTSSITFCFTWRKRKYIKKETTAKLKDKRTSIATMRHLCRTYATFPTPLGSHYRLPFICTCCLHGAGRNDFDGGKSIKRPIGMGGPWKLRLLWALKWQRAKQVPFGPKKVSIFKAQPFQWFL